MDIFRRRGLLFQLLRSRIRVELLLNRQAEGVVIAQQQPQTRNHNFRSLISLENLLFRAKMLD